METTALHERMKSMIGKTTFRALGEATNHNPETVRRYMSGQAPSVEFLSALVGAYSVNADWLLTGRGPMDRTEMRSDALAKADPNELMAAIANRLESMCDRIDRLEVFVQTMETRLRAAGAPEAAGMHTELKINSPQGPMASGAAQRGATKGAQQHDPQASQPTPDDPKAERARSIADALPGRPPEDAR